MNLVYPLGKTQAIISLNPALIAPRELSGSADFMAVDLMPYWQALPIMVEGGFCCARVAMLRKGHKWVRFEPASDQRLSELVMTYHGDYPNEFANKTVSWTALRCDTLEADWFIHPLAPTPSGLH